MYVCVYMFVFVWMCVCLNGHCLQYVRQLPSGVYNKDIFVTYRCSFPMLSIVYRVSFIAKGKLWELEPMFYVQLICWKCVSVDGSVRERGVATTFAAIAAIIATDDILIVFI